MVLLLYLKRHRAPKETATSKSYVTISIATNLLDKSFSLLDSGGLQKDLQAFLKAVNELPTSKVLCVVIQYIFSQPLWAFQTYSKSPIHQSALRIAIPQHRYSAVFGAGGEFEEKRLAISTPQNDLCPDFYQETSFPPPAKIISPDFTSQRELF